MRAFLGGAPEQAGDRYRALSPLERVTVAAPRTLLAHGGRDQVVPHGHMGLLAARLRAMGVPCETLFIPYAQHAFDFVVGGFSDQILEAEVREVPARTKVNWRGLAPALQGRAATMRPSSIPASRGFSFPCAAPCCCWRRRRVATRRRCRCWTAAAAGFLPPPTDAGRDGAVSDGGALSDVGGGAVDAAWDVAVHGTSIVRGDVAGEPRRRRRASHTSR